MQFTLYVLITLLGLSFYVVRSYWILKNEYVPNIFSQLVWLMFTFNSFAGVYFSHSSKASILLALTMVVGNLIVCISSFSKGTRHIGLFEYLGCLFLMMSLFIWIFFNAPLINLSISLIANFIGVIPIFQKIWANPYSENIPFWSLFFLASILSVINSDFSNVKSVILPYYYAFFDAIFILLAARRYVLPLPKP